MSRLAPRTPKGTILSPQRENAICDYAVFPFLKQHRTMFKDKCVVLDLIVFFSNGDDKCNVSAAT